MRPAVVEARLRLGAVPCGSRRARPAAAAACAQRTTARTRSRARRRARHTCRRQGAATSRRSRRRSCALARLREPESRARRALVVPQAAERRIGDRRVREQQLRRREAARAVFGHARARAKERDLHAEVAAARVAHPARDVPPLRAKRGMAAVIARKRERDAALDSGIAHLARARRRGDAARETREAECRRSMATSRPSPRE